MLAFSNDYYGFIFRATQSVEVFCAYEEIGRFVCRQGECLVFQKLIYKQST